jgi:hypothetical protein
MPTLHPLRRRESFDGGGKNGQAHAGGKEGLLHPVGKEEIQLHKELELSCAKGIATPAA